MKVVQHYFLIGFVLFMICSNENCKANRVVECPNLPITPYPPVQTTYPTLPAYPGNVQPISPCQNQLFYPGSVQPTSNCQTICTQNQPGYPIPPIYPGSVQPTNPCPVMCCTTIPSACCQTPTNPCSTTTTSTTILPPTITPATLPPSSLIMCPPGTILIGDNCHIVYCPSGSVMKNDRCMVIECPEGTIWTGHRCSVPEPIVQNFTFNNTITTHINRTTPDIIFNSTKNIVVNLPMTITAVDNNRQNSYEETDKGITTIQNCCKIMTPRICEKHNNRWHCYSRRSHRCGDFCIAPIIYLKPSRVYAKSNYVILPPIQNDCNLYGTCGVMTDGHDCSGCAMNNMSRCSFYCYRYSCPLQKCKFFDQKEFCSNNVLDDMFGCQEADGCYDDWCINN